MTYYIKKLTYPAVLKNKHDKSAFLQNILARCGKYYVTYFPYTVLKAE